jgi:hypothetical protein
MVSIPPNYGRRTGRRRSYSHHERGVLKILFKTSYLYLAFAFLLVVSLFRVFGSVPYWPAHQQVEIPANGRLDAIVTVAMCGFRAVEMVKALRTFGEWKGPIYVVTDTPENESSDLCTPIDVRGNHPRFLTHDEFEAYKRGIHQFKVEIYSKWHKTQIFHLIPDETIQTVLFIDADMLAQQPLSRSWLSGVAPLIADPDCELTLNPERWYTSLPIIGKNNVTLSGKYNSGMMILKRKESRDVLEEWSRRIATPPFVGRDQGKLTDAIDFFGTKLCWLPSHWTHVQNQADLMDRAWFRLHGKGTFLHLSSAKKSKRYRDWNTRLRQSCNYTNLEYRPKI